MTKLKLKSILLCILSCLILSCSNSDMCIDGNGSVITKEMSIDEFEGIMAYGNDHVNISQGETQKIEITGHANIINKLNKNVKNGVWSIELENGCYRTGTELNVDIVLPKIRLVQLIGSGSVVLNDFENQEDLAIANQGSGDIEIHSNQGTENLYIWNEGSGDIEVKSDFIDLKFLEIVINGSGNYDGAINSTDKCNIRSTGSGNCKVFVNQELKVESTGSGNVSYLGEPDIDANFTGSGQLINLN